MTTSSQYLLSQPHINQTIIDPNLTLIHMFANISQYIIQLSNNVNIDCPSLIIKISKISQFLSVDKASDDCDFLQTVLDNHSLSG